MILGLFLCFHFSLKLLLCLYDFMFVCMFSFYVCLYILIKILGLILFVCFHFSLKYWALIHFSFCIFFCFVLVLCFDLVLCCDVFFYFVCLCALHIHHFYLFIVFLCTASSSLRNWFINSLLIKNLYSSSTIYMYVIEEAFGDYIWVHVIEKLLGRII